MSVYLGSSPVGVNAIYSPEAIAQVIINRIYPIGSIYMSVNSANPSTYLGGTWIAWGSGRVPVGVDPNDTSFDTVEETGGAKTHTLTAGQLPKITGAFRKRAVGTSYNDILGASGAFSLSSSTNKANSLSTSGNSITTEVITMNFGNNEAHNNLQPYITCYMWKRTA